MFVILITTGHVYLYRETEKKIRFYHANQGQESEA
jgi:hypothetical protein